MPFCSFTFQGPEFTNRPSLPRAASLTALPKAPAHGVWGGYVCIWAQPRVPRPWLSYIIGVVVSGCVGWFISLTSDLSYHHKHTWQHWAWSWPSVTANNLITMSLSSYLNSWSNLDTMPGLPGSLWSGAVGTGHVRWGPWLLASGTAPHSSPWPSVQPALTAPWHQLSWYDCQDSCTMNGIRELNLSKNNCEENAISYFYLHCFPSTCVCNSRNGI